MTNTVSYIYEILDRYSTPIQRISKMTNRYSKMARKASNATKNLSAKLDRFGQKSQSLSAALGAAGITMAIRKVVNESVKMEDAMADIGRVVDSSDAQLLKFEKTLEGMSENLGKSKLGLAQMAFEGGKLKVTLDKMPAFLMRVSKAAIAFDMMDQEAGRAIGSIQDKMGFMGEDTERLLDSVNFLADTTSANGARMINVIERLSGEFKLLEMPPEIAAGFAGFADRIEVTGELAASGMNMFFNRLKRFPGMTTKLMKDPLGAVNEVLVKMADMGPEVRTKFIQKAFGPEAGRFVQKMVANVGLFDQTMANAMSSDAVGSMTREMENQMNRSSKVFQKFSETTTNTFDAIGDAIKPMIVTLAKMATVIIDKIGKFAEENPKLFRLIAIVGGVVAVVSSLAVVAGVLAAALAPMATLVGVILGPITLLIAAVTAVAAIFIYWDEIISAFQFAWNRIVDAFKDFSKFMTSVFQSGIEKTISMFEDFNKFMISVFQSGLEKIISVFEYLGDTLDWMLSKLENVWGYIQKFINNPIGSIFDGIKDFTGIDIGGIFGSDETAQTSADQRESISRNQVDIRGGIEVSATKGTEIKRANIGLNGGSNLVGAGG